MAYHRLPNGYFGVNAMAGERTMWLVHKWGAGNSFSGESERDAWQSAFRGLGGMNATWRADLEADGWRCSQITVKEAENE